jgi:HD-GYP domain-containing protein (c-di-GMP phosphodiesterase class II)
MMNHQPRQILIVTRKDLLVDVISVFLEGLYPCEITVADSSHKIDQFVAAARGLELLILEDERLLSASGRALSDFLAPAIVVSKIPAPPAPTGRRVVHIPPPVNLDALALAFQQVALSEGAPAREFCSVRLEILVLMGRDLFQDLYAQLPDQSYEIVLKKGARITLNDETFGRLARHRFLFVRSEDFADFIKRFANDIQNLSSGPERIFDLGDSITTTQGVHELISSAIPELGFTPELQAATKASIDLAVKAISRDPKLAELIKSLTAMETSYRSWHSVSLCYIACRLSSLMTWDSANTHYKLSLAAFLHDLTVKTESLERVTTLQELETAAGTEEEKSAFREHPHEAAALSRQMRDFPGDVDHIIAQHHELPNGKGFPLGINHTKISPLAALFIVAHAITEELFDLREKFTLRECVGRLELAYSQGYFRRVIAALKELAHKEAGL